MQQLERVVLLERGVARLRELEQIGAEDGGQRAGAREVGDEDAVDHREAPAVLRQRRR